MMMGKDIDITAIFSEHFPALAETFNQKGHSLKPFQKRVIQNVLDGENTLCLMPTGGGKSLIYWIAGVGFKGITLVISPLVALIDEQSEKLKTQGHEVLTLHSGIGASKQFQLLMQFQHSQINPTFIFASPERLATDGFFSYCIEKRKYEIKLLVIDEVHCVSQWGGDFRPLYKRIPEFIGSVFQTEPPIVLGLSATINPYDIVEIKRDFKVDTKNVFKDDLLIRNEISLTPLKFTKENEKEDKLWELLQIHKKEKTLVYLYRKRHTRGTEDLRDKAISRGIRATNFHGDMSAQERQVIIEQLRNGDIDVVFATNAFGMGIDIPDIRVVIHFMLPESVEQYYQEVGRAARDGNASQAYILYSNKNIDVRQDSFIDKSFPTPDEIREFHSKVTSNQVGLKTILYFEEEEAQKCLFYLVDAGVVSIVDKSIAKLDIFTDVDDGNLAKLIACTKTQNIVKTITNSGIPARDVSRIVFKAVSENKTKLKKPFDKRLLIENHFEEISDVVMGKIEEAIEEKRRYKNDLLDYLVYILDGCKASYELHQEIGLYLGIDKHKLGRIYKTRKGDFVRSKSEVIISNLLYDEGLQYDYETKLFYGNAGKWIEPDFTVTHGGKTYYWEHLGLIGTELYDERWIEKQSIYMQHFPDTLKVTYENAVLTNSALRVISEIKSM